MFFSRFFSNPNQRILDKLQPLLDKINHSEESLKKITDQELKNKTAIFKERLKNGEAFDNILVESFAVVRECASRVLNQIHFDVQILGGLVLNQGKIAEMKTGEGKTLTSTLAVYLNALNGLGVHVITVNDYLAKRDALWMGKIYDFLGLSVACLQHDSAFKYVDDALQPVSRQEAYMADITYGTNHEFGFDYLRDNMVLDLDQRVQRSLEYAIIDEVDSILIDEARTPLIISSPAEKPVDMYYRFADLVKLLKPDDDYHVDEKMRVVSITPKGIEKLEQWLKVDNLYTYQNISMLHHLEQALQAQVLFKKDKNYVIKDGQVIIVDEFTGRLLFGRRYSEGLHQAIEAKERVTIERESITLATITLQNYFRLYKKLAGMTGTAVSSAEELSKIYNLEVVVIPTHKNMIRIDMSDKVYRTKKGKFTAVVEEIKTRHKLGQPVLVGTISIEDNELLSKMLNKEGVPHVVLNAKNHEQEAKIIAEAGKLGAVTCATNMAGRGVDIILGGTDNGDTIEHDKVAALGGLCVIGTERHEARRIDNQLRGRSGRQGDPGSSQFFVSLEDDLMRIFGSEKIMRLMEKLGIPENVPIENRLITSGIEAAQSKVEGHNFDIRKHLVEYDDIINKHREVIYKKRYEILTGSAEEIKNKIFVLLEEEVKEIVTFHTNQSNKEAWDFDGMHTTINGIFNVSLSDLKKTEGVDTEDNVAYRTIIIDQIMNLGQAEYDQLADRLQAGGVSIDQIIKQIYLRSIDTLWIEHIEVMSHLQTGIGLRSYGQKDPLVEYKREAYGLFIEMMRNIRRQVVYSIYKIGIAQDMYKQNSNTATVNLSDGVKNNDTRKVGRNDPCPCGSGKKYKKCHGTF